MKKTAMQEIDQGLLEVNFELAAEELGNRRRNVWYRDRTFVVERNLKLGLPGKNSNYWIKLKPTPITNDISRDFEVAQVGLIQVGDIELKLNRLVIPRTELEKAEFFIAEDDEIPNTETSANWDLLSGEVSQGGGDLRGRDSTYWVCFLRKRQV